MGCWVQVGGRKNLRDAKDKGKARNLGKVSFTCEAKSGNKAGRTSYADAVTFTGFYASKLAIGEQRLQVIQSEWKAMLSNPKLHKEQIVNSLGEKEWAVSLTAGVRRFHTEYQDNSGTIAGTRDITSAADLADAQEFVKRAMEKDRSLGNRAMRETTICVCTMLSCSKCRVLGSLLRAWGGLGTWFDTVWHRLTRFDTLRAV